MYYNTHVVPDGGESNEKHMKNKKPENIHIIQHGHVTPTWTKILHRTHKPQ